MYTKLKHFTIILAVFAVTACTQNQVGSATGANDGYGVSKNAWGTVIGGGAGALVGYELSKDQ